MLISGEGTNLQALIDAAARGRIRAHVALVVSNRAQARGLERARRAGVEALHLDPAAFADRAAYQAALADALEGRSADLVVLAGFMRILEPPFVRRFAGRMLNIHPSLLPSYRGLDTHERVLAAGEQWHGASVHFVTDELDAGPCVIQYRMAVRPDDTAESLARRVHVGEHVILPRAAGWFVDDRLRLAGGKVMLDGRILDQPVLIEETAGDS